MRLENIAIFVQGPFWRASSAPAQLLGLALLAIPLPCPPSNIIIVMPTSCFWFGHK